MSDRDAHSPAEADALDRLLDRGADATTDGALAAPLHPALIATADLVRRGGTPDRPDRTFVAHLEDTLMASFAPSARPLAPHLNGAVPNLPSIIRAPWARRALAPPGRARPARPLSPAANRRRGLIEVVSFAALIAIIFGQAMGLGGRYAFWQDPATPVPAVDRPVAGERVNPGRTGTYPTAGPAGEIGLITRLAPTIASCVNGGRPSFLNPVLAGDDLYQPEMFGGSVSAYDLTTGSYWPGAPTLPLRSNIAVGHGHVYVNSAQPTSAPNAMGALVAVDPDTWAEVWRYPLAGGVDAPVLVFEEWVYVLDAAGTIHAVAGETGEVAWTAKILLADVDTGGGHLEPFAFAGHAWLTAGDGILAVTTGDDTLSTFDIATGKPGWSFQASAAPHLGPPVIADRAVLVLARDHLYGSGAADGALYRLDAATGGERWSWPISAWVMDPAVPEWAGRVAEDALVLTVDDRHAYVSDLGDEGYDLVAVSLADGSEVWRTGLDPAETTAPVVAGETLYLSRGDGRIIALSTLDGTERWQLATGKFGLTTPVVSAERIAVIAGDGTLFVLGPIAEAALPAIEGTPAGDISGMAPCVSPRLQPDPPPVGTPADALPVAPGGSLRLDDLPPGPVVDGDTFAGVFEMLAAMEPCRRTDTERELGGFYSDDYYRRLSADSPEADRRQVHFTVLRQISLDDLNAPYLLPDGRAAMLIYDETDEIGSLVIFVEQDGVWLIDEQQVVERVPCTNCG